MSLECVARSVSVEGGRESVVQPSAPCELLLKKKKTKAKSVLCKTMKGTEEGRGGGS